MEGAFLESLDHNVIGRIGQHDIPARLQFLCLGQILDFHFAADVLRALAPLQLDCLHAQLLDGVFLHAQHGVFHVCLNEDLAVAFRLPFTEALHAPFEVRTGDHLALVKLGFHIHADHILANRQTGAGDCRTDS